MEDSDDSLSFVSASDSEFETEAFPKNLFVKSCASSNQSSPASSVTSPCFLRKNKKRPAPSPPVKTLEIDVTRSIGSDCKNNSNPMTSFAQQFSRGVEKSPSESAVQQCKIIDGFASHPVNIVLHENSTTQHIDQQVQSELKGKNPAESFSKLQLRMIDDLLEPLATDLPISTGIASTPPSHSYINQGIVSYPLQSPIYSSPVYSTLISQPQHSNHGPFYVASVHGQNTATGLSNFSVGSSVPFLEGSDAGSAQYVTVAPLAYVPQLSQQQQLNPLATPMPASHGFGGPILTQKFFNPLSHSASDPGVHHSVTNVLPAPHLPGPSLERLSEADEDDDDDDSYEDVFVKDDMSGNRDLVPVHRKRHRRLERSDSITVAHLYEDIIISSRWKLKVTFTNLTMVVIVTALFLPNSAAILYNFFRLVFGTLFPAYYSYKAVRTKNVKEYVKWMMYWIVFAFFTCAETITDVFFSFWFPFYYEIKILVVLWLLSPATRGSSILYRKFVHPWLTKKEEEIDECIAKAKQQGYSTVVQLGTKGVNYATSVIMQTAIKGGGGIVNQLKRSYSTSEIGEDTADHNSNVKTSTHKESYQSPSEEDDMSISSGQDVRMTRRRLRASRPAENLDPRLEDL